MTQQKIKPQSNKYYRLYQDIAEITAENSAAVRKKVGCVIVAESGMISLGWNGTPPGFDNVCEIDNKTKKEVIHAERNALDKMAHEGVSPDGAILFTTLSPCIECAKSMAMVGIKKVIYAEQYRCTAGIDFLNQCGITTEYKPKEK